jgi:hypothetical protein
MPPRQDAIDGLNRIKQAILDHLEGNRLGATNTEIANALDLQSFSAVSQDKVTGKNFLSHAILGIMVRDGQIVRAGRRYHHPDFRPAPNQ